MTRKRPDQLIRKLDQAEGYLMLDLPGRAIEILESRSDWSSMLFEASFLQGEALRQLGRLREALTYLERASAVRPGHCGVALALGWCYKRTHRLAQAIDALEKALVRSEDEPLLHYNLACYWSLAGDQARAVSSLRVSLKLDPELSQRIGEEPDFAALRGYCEFERLLALEKRDRAAFA